jgi:hypothetical protein
MTPTSEGLPDLAVEASGLDLCATVSFASWTRAARSAVTSPRMRTARLGR